MAANTPDARLRMRNPVPGPRGGGLYVSELQRTRLLDAAFALVAEQGYRRMAARKVAERAGVSPKTFYDLFTDREDCFLAAFDQAVDECSAVARPAYEGESEWAASIRAGLAALLHFLDREPELCRLVFVEALGAGPRVLERRAQILARLESVIDGGRAGGKSARPPHELPPLTAAGIVGATFSVIHGQLVEQPREPLSALLNALMATIVLPYRGRKAAARELSRPTSPSGRGGASRSRTQGAWRAVHASDRGRRDAPPIPALTVRTYAVLAAVGGHPGVSNREVSDLVRVSDQGQISRLMARIDEQGLVENAGGRIQGVAKAWRLTPRGEEVVRANRPVGERAA
jgi:AcrR family transcriptional regulator/DNA-binding MarR family transcriptional regulator